jgi:hypothetical protein
LEKKNLSSYIALSNWIWKIYHIDIILRPKLCQFVQFEISPSMSHKVFIFMKITQMGNFQKYWSQNVGQDFFVLDFFDGRKILKVDVRDGRDPQNWEKNAPARRFTCMFTFHSGPIDFWPSYGPWSLKFGQIFSCYNFITLWFEILTWYLVWECIIISYRSTLKFICYS